jgi:hypothetical protein
MAGAGGHSGLRDAGLQGRHQGVKGQQQRGNLRASRAEIWDCDGYSVCEDNPTILIEDQTLHEGDTIHEVKVLDISADRVRFDKEGAQWEQKVQEPAKPDWWKRKGKEEPA